MPRINSNQQLFFAQWSHEEDFKDPVQATRSLPEFDAWLKTQDDDHAYHDPDIYYGLHQGYDSVSVWFYGTANAPTFETLIKVL